MKKYFDELYIFKLFKFTPVWITLSTVTLSYKRKLKFDIKVH